MNPAGVGVEWSVMGGRSRQGFGPGSGRNSAALSLTCTRVSAPGAAPMRRVNTRHPAIPLEGPPRRYLHRDRVAAEEPSNLTRHDRGHEPIGWRVSPRRVKMTRRTAGLRADPLKGAVEEFDTCATHPVAPSKGSCLVRTGHGTRSTCFQAAQRDPSA